MGGVGNPPGGAAVPVADRPPLALAGTQGRGSLKIASAAPMALALAGAQGRDLRLERDLDPGPLALAAS